MTPMTTADDESVLTGEEDDATLNAWFTYTVNSKDVYTVKLVDINAGVTEVGQSVEDRGEGTDELTRHRLQARLHHRRCDRTACTATTRPCT